MLNGEYPTAFPLKHQQKDLRLVLELAGGVSQPLPVAAAANSLFEQVGRCQWASGACCAVANSAIC